VHDEHTSETVRERGGALLAVTLRSGERVTARVAGGQAEARARLAALQRELATEQHVLLGDDTVLRADEIRSVALVDGAEQPTTVAHPPPGRDEATRYPGGGRRRQGNGGGLADQAQEWLGYGDRPWAETKPFFLTSEFLAALLTTMAVLLAAAIADNLDAPRAWLVAGIVVSAYVVSRGLAKAGSVDPNPARHDRR
jgi:hypothetical protein